MGRWGQRKASRYLS